MWAVGFQGVQRIEPDGTITSVDVPDGRWFDALYLDGLVWIADLLPNELAAPVRALMEQGAQAVQGVFARAAA